jgi:hypothetical protein
LAARFRGRLEILTVGKWSLRPRAMLRPGSAVFSQPQLETRVATGPEH